jgi:hypothetical protein
MDGKMLARVQKNTDSKQVVAGPLPGTYIICMLKLSLGASISFAKGPKKAESPWIPCSAIPE